MDATYTRIGNTVILHLTGICDYGDDVKLLNLTEKAAGEAHTTIAIDLTKMDYINSIGIASLLSILKHTDQNNMDFVLYGMNQKIMLILEKVFVNNFVPLLTEQEFRAKYL